MLVAVRRDLDGGAEESRRRCSSGRKISAVVRSDPDDGAARGGRSRRRRGGIPAAMRTIDRDEEAAQRSNKGFARKCHVQRTREREEEP